MANSERAEEVRVHLDPIETTVVTEHHFIACPHGGCGERWRHRGGITRGMAINLYKIHEGVVHGIQ